MALKIDLIAPSGGGGEGGTTISAIGAPGSGTFGANDQTQWQSADSLAPTITYPSTDTGDYTTVFDGVSFTSLVNLQRGATVNGKTITDNTIFTGCSFTNSSGNGMDVRDIDGLTIVGCTFDNISGTGIRMRSSSTTSTNGTNNVFIWDNDLRNISGNGISSAKRSEDNVDHTNLVIVGNRINDAVTSANDRDHCIYVQATDVTVMFNHINGDRPGNGISVRTAAFIHHNTISITKSDNFVAGIRYTSDHLAGPVNAPRSNDKFYCTRNSIDGNSSILNGININYDNDGALFGYTNPEWHVNDVQISNNTIANVTGADYVFSSFWNGQSWIDILLEGVKQNS